MASSTIRSICDALRALHRTLLEVERREYERSFGRTASDFYLLQLVAQDPQFAWLRALAPIMLGVDAMVARGELSTTEMRLLETRIRALTLADDPMTSFQHRYQRILRQHLATIVAHGELMRLLPPASPVQFFVGHNYRTCNMLEICACEGTTREIWCPGARIR